MVSILPAFCLLCRRFPLAGSKGCKRHVFLWSDSRSTLFLDIINHFVAGTIVRKERNKKKKKKKSRKDGIDRLWPCIRSGVQCLLSSLITLHYFLIEAVIGTDTDIILAILAADGLKPSPRIIISIGMARVVHAPDRASMGVPSML